MNGFTSMYDSYMMIGILQIKKIYDMVDKESDTYNEISRRSPHHK